MLLLKNLTSWKKAWFPQRAWSSGKIVLKMLNFPKSKKFGEKMVMGCVEGPKIWMVGTGFFFFAKFGHPKKRLGDTANGENVIKIGQSIRGVFAHHSLG